MWLVNGSRSHARKGVVPRVHDHADDDNRSKGSDRGKDLHHHSANLPDLLTLARYCGTGPITDSYAFSVSCARSFQSSPAQPDSRARHRPRLAAPSTAASRCCCNVIEVSSPEYRRTHSAPANCCSSIIAPFAGTSTGRSSESASTAEPEFRISRNGSKRRSAARI